MMQLQANDGTVVEADSDAMRAHSVMLHDMLGDLPDTPSVPIPLANVDAACLRSIVAWVGHQATKPAPAAEPVGDAAVPQESRAPVDLQSPLAPALPLDDWESAFMAGLDTAHVIALTMAVNYMNIASLQQACVDRIASECVGRTTEELRAHFHIVNDLTPEEEAEIQKENAWCQEVAS